MKGVSTATGNLKCLALAQSMMPNRRDKYRAERGCRQKSHLVGMQRCGVKKLWQHRHVIGQGGDDFAVAAEFLDVADDSHSRAGRA